MKDLHTIEIYNNNFREFDIALLKDLNQLKVLKLDYSKLKSFNLDELPKFKVKLFFKLILLLKFETINLF